MVTGPIIPMLDSASGDACAGSLGYSTPGCSLVGRTVFSSRTHDLVLYFISINIVEMPFSLVSVFIEIYICENGLNSTRD